MTGHHEIERDELERHGWQEEHAEQDKEPNANVGAADGHRAGHDNHPGHKQGQGGHVDHTGHEQMFRGRFWICLVLSIPVLIFSPAVQGFLGYNIPAFSGSQWITPVFSPNCSFR